MEIVYNLNIFLKILLQQVNKTLIFKVWKRMYVMSLLNLKNECLKHPLILGCLFMLVE